MKVTRWIDWQSDKYIDDNELSLGEYEEARQAVINNIKEKGYKLCGQYHQNGDYGCPVIDDKYIFRVSMRCWGRIMAEALDLPDKDGMGYCEWAWSPPAGENQILPTGDDNNE